MNTTNINANPPSPGPTGWASWRCPWCGWANNRLGEGLDACDKCGSESRTRYDAADETKLVVVLAREPNDRGQAQAPDPRERNATMTTENPEAPKQEGVAAVACTDGLGMGDRVRLLTDVPGLGAEGETGDIIGCHPGCGRSSYTVRMDNLNWRGELRCNGCAADEIEKMPNDQAHSRRPAND